MVEQIYIESDFIVELKQRTEYAHTQIYVDR